MANCVSGGKDPRISKHITQEHRHRPPFQPYTDFVTGNKILELNQQNCKEAVKVSECFRDESDIVYGFCGK
jgi:hypothetical protein